MEEIPPEADVLILTTPRSDLSTLEVGKIVDFLDTGGRALFMIDITPTPMPNLDLLTEAFGVVLGGIYVHEGDSGRHFPQRNNLIFPLMADHQINSRNLSNGVNPLLLEGQAIWNAPYQRTFLTAEPLLISTAASFGRDDPDNLSVNQMEGEPDGPFALAVAVEDSFTGPGGIYVTRLVLVGTSNILDPGANGFVHGANGEFLISSINWLLDRTDVSPDSVFIQPRSLLDDQVLRLTQAEQNNIMVFSLGVLPGTIVITGFFVWIKRRRS